MASSDPGGFGATFRFTLLTNDPDLAAAADAAGVDRIGLDIERLGKAERQEHTPTARISNHELSDLVRIRDRVSHARLFCRLDPPHPGSGEQIERALDLGANCLMLPFFREVGQAAAFAAAVDGRAETILLVESAAAAFRIEPLAALEGVDEIMVGLNDLSWDSGLGSRFELLASPLVEAMARTVRAAGKVFGIGGVARWDDQGMPTPADLVYAQYPRLGAKAGWLSRSFLDGLGPDDLAVAVGAARDRLDHWSRQDAETLEGARRELSQVFG